VKSKAIGIAKAKGEDTRALMDEVAKIGDSLKQVKATRGAAGRTQCDRARDSEYPHASVPDGKDERDNAEVRRWGEPQQFDFTPRDHVDLGERMGLMDFEGAAKISAARFVVSTGRWRDCTARLSSSCSTCIPASTLQRDLCAVPGQCRQHARYRSAAEVRGRLVRCQGEQNFI